MVPWGRQRGEGAKFDFFVPVILACVSLGGGQNTCKNKNKQCTCPSIFPLENLYTATKTNTKTI